MDYNKFNWKDFSDTEIERDEGIHLHLFALKFV